MPLDFPFYLYSFCLSLFFLSILPPTQRAPTAQGPMVATPGSMMAASTAPNLYPSSETAFLIHDSKYIWTLQFINIQWFTEIKFSFLHFLCFIYFYHHRLFWNRMYTNIYFKKWNLSVYKASCIWYFLKCYVYFIDILSNNWLDWIFFPVKDLILACIHKCFWGTFNWAFKT